MTVELWRHKPVVKKAVEWTGDNAAEVIEFAGDKAYLDEMRSLVVCTPQGEMIPAVGDWILQGVEGAFYPCPGPIFLASYERVGRAG